MNVAFNKTASPYFPMTDVERAITMTPNVNVGPTVSLGIPTGGPPVPVASFFSDHAAFQDYINKIKLDAAIRAENEARGSAEAGSRRNLLGLAALGGLGGGLIGAHRAKKNKLEAAMSPALLGAALGGIGGTVMPSSIGDVSMGAGLGAIPGAYLGAQIGKKYPKYAIPGLIAGLLGGAGLGAAIGK